jgi:uncharacterized protein (DUF302 family)
MGAATHRSARLPHAGEACAAREVPMNRELGRHRPDLRALGTNLRAAALALLLAVPATGIAQGPNEIVPGPVVSIPSLHDFATTLARLEAAIEEAGLTLVIAIDHAANADAAGHALRPATVLVFGNPEAGTPLMQLAPTLALDLPQRMLVWEDEAGVVFVSWRDPVLTAAEHGLAADEGALPDIASLLPLLAEVATGPGS